MKEIRFVVNYGGYIGSDDEYSIYVDDDATPEEIDEDTITEEDVDIDEDEEDDEDEE